ncbi:Thiamin pyrophosphokinase [Xylona heveae TC161]|uniref:Thiamine pyrophosphokinase n=1 Tax=Xylona heveae (strain CBS 132557 / TC161) TaxID=1328760 RepID=A0A165F9I5_XYLHT|nr:Thiamin pyrophosphokinase [Xylona heveae TC161]KZF20736.1 Thiamin pyrophosphokinase [Xylona heveae TC161]
MATSTSPYEWRPVEYMKQGSKAKFALLILNQPITDIPVFERLWENAAVKICADGGANRLHDLLLDRGLSFTPNIIHGDLDSLRSEVEQYYQDKPQPPIPSFASSSPSTSTVPTVEISKDPDQYSSDFTKCLKRLARFPEPMDVIALGGLGGRVDQGFSQVHHLYMASLNNLPGDGAEVEGASLSNPRKENQPITGRDKRYYHDAKSLMRGRDLYLYSEQSISFVLHPGQNKIYTPMSEGYLTENVGIIPVGKPAKITIEGFEWDVQDWPTEFGGQVSTSNHIRSDVLMVETNERVLFTLERTEGWS